MSFDVNQAQVLIASSLVRPHLGERLVAIVLRDACKEIDTLRAKLAEVETRHEIANVDLGNASVNEKKLALRLAVAVLRFAESQAREAVMREALSIDKYGFPIGTDQDHSAFAQAALEKCGPGRGEGHT